MTMSDYNYSLEEWQACIKVLKILAKEPDKGMDMLVIKGLVTKIYKEAKKQNKINKVVNKVAEIPTQTLNSSLDVVRKAQSAQRKLFNQSLAEKTILHQNYFSSNNSENTNDLDKNSSYIFQKKCYICKTPFKEIHFFYPTLCPNCSMFNFSKREQKSDLQGRIALVTGGRIKIGYLSALNLLRNGAKVWVTTRFAIDAALRFSKEKDFENWSDRLKIVNLDLRNIKALHDFIDYFLSKEQYLDIVINNAAQTIKRPKAYYEHMFENENQLVLPEHVQKILPKASAFQFLETDLDQKLLPADFGILFPKGLYDKHNQQIDRRLSNSWTLKLEEISTVEMLETQLVGVTAPFILNSRLKALLNKSPFNRRFVVNVSAMEGQFNRSSKTPFHPHTNMAKAALNMMTRTSAQEFAQSNIFMNSVDTGWITQENPLPKAEKIFEEQGFVPPLDEIDGMARILDPVYCGINHQDELPLFGHFLKDYKSYIW